MEGFFRQITLTLFITLTAGLSTPAQAVAKEAEYLKLLTQAGKLIIPAHKDLVNSTEMMQKAVEAFCVEPNTDKLEEARSQWRIVMSHWMKVSLLQFGPLQKDDLKLRFQSWPVRYGLIKRAVEKIANSSIPVSDDDIENGSVAVQGLPALEYLLFKPNSLADFTSDRNDKARCHALSRIAEHSYRLAFILVGQWTAHAGKDFQNPSVIEGGMQSAQEAVDEYLNGLQTALQQISRRKLEEPFGLDGRTAKKTALESHYSRNSLSNISNNMEALQQFYLGGSGYGFDDYLKNQDDEELLLLDTTIRELFTEIQSIIKSMSAILEESINTPHERETVINLHSKIKKLESAFENKLFRAVGVTRDFNSEDGD